MSNTKSKKKYSVISLFAGCGGLDLGFIGGFKIFGKRYSKRNFDLIWSNDSDKNACLTYEKNFGEKNVCGDIIKILKGNMPDLFAKSIPKRADIVLGGFPCQDFSVAGKRRGFNSERGNLYKSMVEVVKKTKPLVFMAENVKGLLSINDGTAIDTIKSDFSKLGYEVTHELFHVANYGVPENRERVIIVGTKTSKGLPKFIFPKPSVKENSWLTVKEAISDLANLQEGALPNHYWSKAKRFVGTQGNITISKNKVAPTMRAEHHGNIEFHWNGKRRLSAREAARIQSFPDNFIFYPSTSSAYKQIGNAVPPVFGWHLAKSLESFLNKHLNK
jgi:DNA (cytosine-5)-methyltransferase 1